MRLSRLGWILLGVWGGAAAADATFLERLAALDVNDYSLGIVVSRSDNVYAGSADSVTIYPVLSNFYPSDFDDGILFSRDGGLGVRWAPPSGLELGVLAKVQGLGFAAEDSAALGGMPDRDWTIEAGPTIGWRRWRVNVDWTGYVDLLRRHDGGNQYLRVSVPMRRDRSYLVPEIGVRRYSPRFVSYYYGVPAAVATPDRPAYEGAAASNASLAIEWGVRIKRSWLLSGRVGMEWLDSSITDSPIVSDDERAFASLRLSYDEPVFAPLKAPAHESARPPPFARVQLTTASLDVKTSLALLARNGSMVDSSSADGELQYVDVLLRSARRHRVAAAFFDSGHEPVDAAVRGGVDLRGMNLAYGIRVLDDPQKDLTLFAGLQLSELELATESTGSIAAGSRGPRPILGAAATLRFDSKWFVSAEIQWSMLDHYPFRGRRVFAALALSHRTFRRMSFGLGYIFDRLHLESHDEAAGTQVDARYRGPSLSITGWF